MARAELDVLLDKMSGRFTGKSKFYTTHRYGRTVISNYPLRRNPKSITAHQHELNTSFGEISKQAKAELQNAERLAYWQNMYEQYRKLANKNLPKANAEFFNIDPTTTPLNKQKYYKTLRGFVIAQLRKES